MLMLSSGRWDRVEDENPPNVDDTTDDASPNRAPPLKGDVYEADDDDDGVDEDDTMTESLPLPARPADIARSGEERLGVVAR